MGGGHCAMTPPLGHGTKQKKRVKNVKISVLRLKWNTNMEKD